jgi:hypothetical protein
MTTTFIETPDGKRYNAAEIISYWRRDRTVHLQTRLAALPIAFETAEKATAYLLYLDKVARLDSIQDVNFRREPH